MTALYFYNKDAFICFSNKAMTFFQDIFHFISSHVDTRVASS